MFLFLKRGSCFRVQVSISLLFSCLSPLNVRKAEEWLEWVPWSRIGSWNQNPELESGFSSHCTTFLVCSVCGERMWATEKQTESLQLGELKRTQARCTNMLEEKKKPVGSCEGCKADGVSWKTRLPHFSAALGARLSRARSLNYSVSLMSSSRPGEWPIPMWLKRFWGQCWAPQLETRKSCLLDVTKKLVHSSNTEHWIISSFGYCNRIVLKTGVQAFFEVVCLVRYLSWNGWGAK